MENLNSALFLIEKFAALAATPGIDAETIKIVNMHIQNLLSGPVKESLSKLSASAAGLII